jgi:hypothetical protein
MKRISTLALFGLLAGLLVACTSGPASTSTTSPAQQTIVAAPSSTPLPTSTATPNVTPATATTSVPRPANTPVPSPTSPPATTVAQGDGPVAGTGLTCPAGYPVKANTNSGIYHVPGQKFYDATNARNCYRTEQAAQAAGYRKSKV